jgi:hypothetical protein
MGRLNLNDSQHAPNGFNGGAGKIYILGKKSKDKSIWAREIKMLESLGLLARRVERTMRTVSNYGS